MNKQKIGLSRSYWLPFCLFGLFGLFASCEKAIDPVMDEEYPDYIIFGKFTTGTWCSGETCVEKFKIDTDGLHEDQWDLVPQAGQISEGNFTSELSRTDYDQIIALLEKNNYKTLLDQQQSSLGTLWTDNFHFYFEYKSGDEHRSWIIDGSFDGSVPQILQPFLFDLNQMIQIAQF